jgi:hypothetical protein
MANGSSDDKRVAVFTVADCTDDYDWLVRRFRQLLSTVTDPNVLSAAIYGMGYIARRFRYGDERELKKMLRPFEKIQDPMLAGALEQAKWDIYVYLSRERRQRKRELRRAKQGRR